MVQFIIGALVGGLTIWFANINKARHEAYAEKKSAYVELCKLCSTVIATEPTTEYLHKIKLNMLNNLIFYPSSIQNIIADFMESSNENKKDLMLKSFIALCNEVRGDLHLDEYDSITSSLLKNPVPTLSRTVSKIMNSKDTQ